MSNLRDPVRFSEEPGGLPEAFTESLNQYGEVGPSDAQRSRVLANVLAQGGGAGSQRSGFRLPAWTKFVLGFLALAGLGSWMLRSAPVVQPPVVLPAPVPALEPSPPVTAVPPGEEQEPQVRPLDHTGDQPGTKVPAERRRPKRRLAVEDSKREEPGLLEAEISLLRRAQRALVADPERALSLSSEHRATYPEGVLTEERELLTIEALVRLGRPLEARAAATAFGRAFPDSAHRERIRVLLDSEASAPAPVSRER